MGCIQVSIKPLGGISVKHDKVGYFENTWVLKSGISVNTTEKGGINTKVKPKSGIQCRAYQVCTVNIRGPYLKINPTIVWVVAGYTQNDVFSNTDWNIR